MKLRTHIVISILVASGCLLPACAGEDSVVIGGDDLTARSDAEWFYTGPLSKLETPSITVSLKGHTARLTGYLPATTKLPDMPHVLKLPATGGRQRLEIVYPIATAALPSANPKPGNYQIDRAIPYRPDGYTVTKSNPTKHVVPWGGFPFLDYNATIAFHGPITTMDNKADDALEVWHLRRGPVSAGCSRMNGEHVVELSHAIGISMRKLYAANIPLRQAPRTPVNVIEGYDTTIDGKLIDVDYPTHGSAVRPSGDVQMFGSWMGSESSDLSDLPKDLKWEGGVNGKYYVFSEHVKSDWVCSYPKGVLPPLAELAKQFPGNELPNTVCAKKDCIVEALRLKKDAKTVCGL